MCGQHSRSSWLLLDVAVGRKLSVSHDLVRCAVGGIRHENDPLVIFDAVAGSRGIPRRGGGGGTASTGVRAALPFELRAPPLRRSEQQLV